MFTGIVREIGAVSAVTGSGNLRRLAVESKLVGADAAIGDSVSVNGVCLTVVKKDKRTLFFEMIAQTVERTTLGSLRSADRVNLEGSLRVGEQLGGHFVLGHIDCIGEVTGIMRKGDDISIEIVIPKESGALIVEKGSVAIDGVSLTVGVVSQDRFVVHIIPHTLEATTLGSMRKGRRVNIEFDVLGKYILRYLETRGSRGVTEGFLKDKGFA